MMKNIFIKYKKIILFICIVIIFTFLFWKFTFIKEVALVLIASFILAYVLRPIHKKIKSYININDRLLAVLIILSIILMIIGMITIIIPSVMKESISLNSIIGNLEGLVEELVYKINMPKEEFYSIINNQFGEKINLTIKGITEKIFICIIDFSENIIALAIVPIVAYYFLADGETIRNKGLLFFSVEKRNIVKKILRDIDKMLGKYVISQFSLCLFVGILTFIGLLFLDIKFALLLSIVNGMLNIVPYFGAFLGVVPAVLIALMDSPMKVISVLILFLIIQQLEGNILAPKITASSIEMHPLVVVILLLVGEKVWGLIGMILIIPIGVIIKIVYEDIDYYLF